MRYPVRRLVVRLRSDAGTDRLGNSVPAYSEPQEVEGCLWSPSAPQNLADSRPEGAHISATAHFPRGWKGDLRDALVSVDGDRWLRVIGDPLPYPAGTVRGRWDRQVLLAVDNG